MNIFGLVFYLIALFVFGAILGSFACCQVWRIRYKAEHKKDLGKRSVCLSCGHQLGWKENIPVISWLMQRGKCTKCGKKIGWLELVSEIATGVVFVVIGLKFYNEIFSNIAWLGVVKLVLVLIVLTAMVVLFIYDAKWGEMPTKVLTIANVFAGLYLAVNLVSIAMYGGGITGDRIFSIVSGIAILPGLYFLLYTWSKEKLVGGGDWILCMAIALILASWWLDLVVLFVANLLGSIIMAPIVYRKKRLLADERERELAKMAREGKELTLPQDKNVSQIAFGPFLIIAFILVFLLADYLSSLGVESLMHLF